MLYFYFKVKTSKVILFLIKRNKNMILNLISKKKKNLKIPLFIIFFLGNLIKGVNWTGNQSSDFIINNGDTIKELRVEPLSNSIINITLAGGTVSSFNSASFFHIHTLDSSSVVNFNIQADLLLNGFTKTEPLVLEFSGPGKLYINIPQGVTFSLGSGNSLASSLPVYFIINGDESHLGLVRVNKLPGVIDTDNSVLELNFGSIITFSNYGSGTDDNGILELNGHSDSSINKNNGVLLLKLNNASGLILETINVQNNPSLGNNIYSDLNFALAEDFIIGQPKKFTFLRIVNIDPITNIPVTTYNKFYSSVVIECNNSIPVPLRCDLNSTSNFMHRTNPISLVNFSVPRSGVVVSDGGTIEIADAAYMIYVAAGYNYNPLYVDGSISLGQITKIRNPSALLMDGKRSYETNIYDESFLSNPSNVLPEGDLQNLKPYMPKINLLGKSALYFMASRGINSLVNMFQIGAVNSGGNANKLDYLVPSYRQPLSSIGYGNVAFVNEGQAAIIGLNSGKSILSVLSTEFNLSGGSLLPAKNTESIFPQRTFSLNSLNGTYNQYGKACLMFGDILLFSNASLLHTDLIHRVYPFNIVSESEPTYIGGDHFAFIDYYYEKGHPQSSLLNAYLKRPKIILQNSDIVIANKTGACFAGVDLLYTTANRYDADSKFISSGDALNKSNILFLADGTDDTKYFILGSENDGSVFKGDRLDCSSHLDVMQYGDPLSVEAFKNVTLSLKSKENSSDVLENISFLDSISLKHPIATIYTSEFSNISIGGNYNSLENETALSKLTVDDKYINFATKGGFFKDIQLAAPSGSGIISVFEYGIFQYNNNSYGSINIPIKTNISPSKYNDFVNSNMIKNPNIIIPLEIASMGFNGIEGYSNSSVAPEIISANDIKFSYVYDPKVVTSGFVNSHNESTLRTFPLHYRAAFELIDPFTGDVALKNSVSSNHIQNVPVIKGKLGLLTIKPSFSMPLLRIDGGRIYEISFDTNYSDFHRDGSLAAAFILKNSGSISLGKTTGKTGADILGTRGVRIIVEDSGTIDLNSDIFCLSTNQFMSVDDNPSFITINSTEENKIIVPTGETFDLTGLNNGSIVSFTGKTALVMEAGSVLAIPKGVILQFNNSTSLEYESGKETNVNDLSFSYIVGEGSIVFNDSSELNIPRRAFVSISSLGTCNALFSDTEIAPVVGFNNIVAGNLNTDINLSFNDEARFLIGNRNNLFGGSFEIGNRVNRLGASVSATISFDGNRTLWDLGKQGFLGCSAGIISKPDSQPNLWSIHQLYNVSNIEIALYRGVFQFNQIYSGADISSSLIAFGYSNGLPGSSMYTVGVYSARGGEQGISGEDLFDTTNVSIALLRGGSNLVVLTENGSILSSFYPIVTDLIGNQELSGNYLPTILQSSGHFTLKGRNLEKQGSLQLFNFLSPYDPSDPLQNNIRGSKRRGGSDLASISQDGLNGVIGLGYIGINSSTFVAKIIRKQFPFLFNFKSLLNIDEEEIRNALSKSTIHVGTIKQSSYIS